MKLLFCAAICLASVPPGRPFHNLPSKLPLEKSGYTPYTADIIQFYGLVFDEGISLHWISAPDRGTAGFRLERSHDGRTFRPLGYVEAGYQSSFPIHYSYTDSYPFPGNNYYRLSAEDPGGSISAAVLLELYSWNTYTPGIRVFPNPFQREIMVQLPRQLAPDARLSLLTLNGAAIQHWPTGAGHRITMLHLPELPPGSYILFLQNGTQNFTARLVRSAPPP